MKTATAEKRMRLLPVRLSDEEREAFGRAAKEDRMPLGTWLRHLAWKAIEASKRRK